MKYQRLFQEPNVNLTGCLLVASPHWSGSEFQQTVCLIAHHSADGAVGVILNRRLPLNLKVFFKAPGRSQGIPLPDKVHLGGPNSGPVVAMHQRKDLAEFISADGVYFAARAELLQSLLEDDSRPWKIFVGQAVWRPGALDDQFARGLWLPIQVDSRIVFADPDQVWPLAVRHAGNLLIQNLVGIENGAANNPESN